MPLNTIRRLGVSLCLVAILNGAMIPPTAMGRGDDWNSVTDRLGGLAPGVGFLAAEIVDGDCQTIHESNGTQRLAIGSAFKLYVLAELGRQIASGDASWDERIPVQAGLKSMPSGSMLYAPNGSRHTLRYFAERMIAESDNTATDHLIERLGRERIESALPLFGHDAPEVNTPFLMTREFFAFKISVKPERVDQYLSSSEDEQRAILSNEIDPIQLNEFYWGDWTGPRRIDSVEWFASPMELCHVLATLTEMAETPLLAPIRDILSLNRGGLGNPQEWPYAGYKGGYEAGVFNMTWLLQRDDHRWFVLTATLNDPKRYVDQAAAWQSMVLAASRLGAES